MAWIFSLSAECGADESSAKELANYFGATTFFLKLSDNRIHLCRTDTFQDIENNWWFRVYPDNITEVGIDSPENAYLMTELGLVFYEALKFDSTFRYALVGVEVDEFRTYSELIEDLPNLAIPGLVLSTTFEKEVEIPPVFQPFSDGYVWQPYEGEVYNPLMVSPELKSKLDQLSALS
ncbi:hypothetical protein PN483_10320 [Nodularia spumigena CS-591/04]|uniref:hypothetical protein n=1 Tax=Nodularia spumigena TaxID=70799 RepID=UPI00232E0155|nr:hypothetical protein [Nodularia spumigena]MDB9320715.1 hypothetical protein [Nodularia spumigena CS-591/07A]MDB9330882.1 hypothetical protein [Nodularia spumigena CS-591/04]